MGKTNQYFSFSKRERTGVIVILTVILIIFSLPEFLPDQHRSIDMKAVAEFQELVADFKTNDADSAAGFFRTNGYNEFPSGLEDGIERKAGDLFHFDPNTITLEDWKNLGISGRTAKTIMKYISKGGQFRKPGDLGKIFGLPKTQYERLLPFIRIQGEIHEKLPSVIEAGARRYQQTSERTLNIFEINTADTSSFIALPGIGSKLANRIINFREKLGGFHSIDQLKETYGLQDSILLKIIPFLECDNSKVRQININTANEAVLKSHPYFKWNIANGIINYREQHGQYEKVEDLLNIHFISPDIFQKLAPYCKVNEEVP